MYDVFIPALMVVGISSLVLLSYKILHSRVYPVGIVRRVPAAQECVDEASTELPGSLSGSQTELISLVAKGWTNKEIARDLNLSEYTVRSRLHRILRKLDAKQQPSSPTVKQQHELAHYYLRQQNPFHEREDSPLEEEVVEHGEALKLHSKQFEDFEKRIRRLEVESVQKLQEDAEEKPQPTQVVH